MNTFNKVKVLVITGLLCSLGILIPLTFPRATFGPASFTLASHVAIYIAMFISPTVAVSVSCITTLGFFIAGTPMVIVLRAATHLLFAAIGAFILKKNSNLLQSKVSSLGFSFGISVIHAIAEVFVVSLFFLSDPAAFENNYLTRVLLLVGIGTLIHSMVDFYIATFVWQPLYKIIPIPANAKVWSYKAR